MTRREYAVTTIRQLFDIVDGDGAIIVDDAACNAALQNAGYEKGLDTEVEEVEDGV